MGGGIGGGRKGRFWGGPIFGQNPLKYSIFPQKDANRGTPKTAIPTTTHPIPHVKPSDFVWAHSKRSWRWARRTLRQLHPSKVAP